MHIFINEVIFRIIKRLMKFKMFKVFVMHIESDKKKPLFVDSYSLSNDKKYSQNIWC